MQTGYKNAGLVSQLARGKQDQILPLVKSASDYRSVSNTYEVKLVYLVHCKYVNNTVI